MKSVRLQLLVTLLTAVAAVFSAGTGRGSDEAYDICLKRGRRRGIDNAQDLSVAA